MPGIGIIANPHSKLNKRDPWRRNLLGYIVGEQGRVEITNSLDDLRKVAADLRKKNIDILAINGGDGTVSQTITAFINAYENEPLPKIAILRGGTMNMLANNLSLSGTPEELLYRIVDAYSASKTFDTIRLHALEVEGHYGFLFGNGVAAKFLDIFYKNKTGTLGVLSLILRLISSTINKGTLYREVLRRLPTRINAQERTLIFDSLLVMCSTVPKMPLGPVLFPDAGHDKHHIQCLSITELSKNAVLQLAKTIMLTKRQHNVSGQFQFCAQRIDIESELNSLYTIDGELLAPRDSGKLSIRLGPEIEFIRI